MRWFFKLIGFAKSLWQCMHSNLTWKCLLLCTFRSSLVKNNASHSLHLWFLSLVLSCMLQTCLRYEALSKGKNVFEQYWHLRVFSQFPCFRCLCFFKLSFEKNVLSHVSQFKMLPSVFFDPKWLLDRGSSRQHFKDLLVFVLFWLFLVSKRGSFNRITLHSIVCCCPDDIMFDLKWVLITYYLCKSYLMRFIHGILLLAKILELSLQYVLNMYFEPKLVFNTNKMFGFLETHWLTPKKKMYTCNRYLFVLRNLSQKQSTFHNPSTNETEFITGF